MRKNISGVLKKIATTISRSILGIAWPVPSLQKKILEVIGNWYPSRSRSKFEDIVFRACFDFYVHRIYLTEPDPDRREQLKERCMGGQSGVEFANAYENEAMGELFGDMTWDDAIRVFPVLEHELSNAPAGTIVVQIGSSSGKEIAYFAARHPQHSFIGLDIDEAIVNRSSQVHKLPRLRFIVGRAHTVLEDCNLPKLSFPRNFVFHE